MWHALGALILIGLLLPPYSAFAQGGATGGVDTGVPSIPAKETPAPTLKEPSPPLVEEPAPAPKPTVKHRPRVRHAQEGEIEPASGRLQLKKDTYIYSRPTRLSKTLIRAHSPKYLTVTGATRYYLRVKLKDGRVGYVPTSAVNLVKPSDKDFLLSSDSPVYADPNRWSKKVAEVHKGHNVHVVGIALNYLKIRMKSGLVGYIPIAAAE